MSVAIWLGSAAACAFVGYIVGRRERAALRDCFCGWQEPYGFVPEADCPLHDNAEFVARMNGLRSPHDS